MRCAAIGWSQKTWDDRRLRLPASRFTAEVLWCVCGARSRSCRETGIQTSRRASSQLKRGVGKNEQAAGNESGNLPKAWPTSSRHRWEFSTRSSVPGRSSWVRSRRISLAWETPSSRWLRPAVCGSARLPSGGPAMIPGGSGYSSPCRGPTLPMRWPLRAFRMCDWLRRTRQPPATSGLPSLPSLLAGGLPALTGRFEAWGQKIISGMQSVQETRVFPVTSNPASDEESERMVIGRLIRRMRSLRFSDPVSRTGDQRPENVAGDGRRGLGAGGEP